MNQSRQTQLCYNDLLDEYRVKLFINGIYQPEADYFTDDKIDAQETAREMISEGQASQEDFCKVGKHVKPKTEKHDWPVYTENGELVGFLNLSNKQEMPQSLFFQDCAYVRTKLTRLAD